LWRLVLCRFFFLLFFRGLCLTLRLSLAFALSRACVLLLNFFFLGCLLAIAILYCLPTYSKSFSFLWCFLLFYYFFLLDFLWLFLRISISAFLSFARARF
jgi:hypothetical protein